MPQYPLSPDLVKVLLSEEQGGGLVGAGGMQDQAVGVVPEGWGNK